MLPFLKKRNEGGIAGILIAKRNPNGMGAPGAPEAEEQPDDSDASIHSAAQDLIDAVHAKDVAACAAAISAAFQILESAPHEEADHTNEEQE